MNKLIIAIALMGSLQLFGQIELMDNKIVVTNESKINSEHLEYSPTFYQDGIVFITSRSKTIGSQAKDHNIGTNVMNIFQARRNADGYLKAPEPMSTELNSWLHDGPLTFNATGDVLYFTRNEKKKAADGKQKLQIYVAEKKGDYWTNIKKLPFNEKEYNFTHPSISIDGQQLFFASDKPNGLGGMDLYKVTKMAEGWSEPENLGSAINTLANEVFPFYHADQTLYFASDGHGGLGGLDIFYSYQNDLTWEVPTNLDQPFNSYLDDFGFLIDLENKNGYFSSNRPMGQGKDDIYSFYRTGEIESNKRKKKKQAAVIALADEAGNSLEGTKITYALLDEVVMTAGEKDAVRLRPISEHEFTLYIDADEIGETRYADQEGKQNLMLGDGTYVVTFSKPGYLPKQIITTADTDLSALNITLEKAANCIPVNGKVLVSTGEFGQSSAAIEIVNTVSKETMTVYADANGNYDYCLPCNGVYSLYASKNGANSKPIFLSTQTISCRENQALTANLYLDGQALMPADGDKIALPNVYFNFNDAGLRPDARKDLAVVKKLLNAYPNLKVELSSHTDARGSKAYNQALSERRAQNIYEHLVSNGIGGSRLVVKGYGESQIRNGCVDGVRCSEADHQYNRRTEVIILSNDADLAVDANVMDEDGLFVLSSEGEKVKATPYPVPEKIQRTLIGQDVDPATKKEPISTSQNQFLVLAGAFKDYENAVRREQLLRLAGYDEVVILDLSNQDLFAICVQKTDTPVEANALAEELKTNEGINAYVKKGRTWKLD